MPNFRLIDDKLCLAGPMILLFTLQALATQALAGEQAATGFTLNTGIENAGSYADTAFADGVDHVLYESSVSPKRLDAVYHLGAISGTSPALELSITLATTGGGQGVLRQKVSQ